MSDRTHSDLPWVVEQDYVSAMIPGCRPNGEIIICCHPTAENHRCSVPNVANATFLVRACNAHYGLVAACEEAADWMDMYEENEDRGLTIDLTQRLRAAIAKAEGGE